MGVAIARQKLVGREFGRERGVELAVVEQRVIYCRDDGKVHHNDEDDGDDDDNDNGVMFQCPPVGVVIARQKLGGCEFGRERGVEFTVVEQHVIYGGDDGKNHDNDEDDGDDDDNDIGVMFQCPPVGVAIARQKLGGREFGRERGVEFPVVELADAMGWDSGPVKRQLRDAMWTHTPQG